MERPGRRRGACSPRRGRSWTATGRTLGRGRAPASTSPTGARPRRACARARSATARSSRASTTPSSRPTCSGRWPFLNESWARWTGIPVADALGRPAYELVHPDDRAAHARAFAPLVAGEVDSVRLRHRYVTADGVTRWAEVRAQLARDTAGRPLGIAGVIEDVTERSPDAAVRGRRAGRRRRARRGGRRRGRRAGAARGAVPPPGLGPRRAVDARPRARGAALHRRVGLQRRAGLEALEAAREGVTFEVGDGLQGQAWARRAPIWASGLQDDPLFRRGAAAAAAGVRSALALPIVARRASVLATILFFSRERARSRSGPRPAAADDRRAPGAVPRSAAAPSARSPSAPPRSTSCRGSSPASSAPERLYRLAGACEHAFA